MGSERLAHAFSALDPTYKKNSFNESDKPTSHESLSHTSGTQPVSISDGPSHSSPSSSTKINPKYRKLIKLYHRQLTHISTTLDAIEKLSKPGHIYQDNMILSNKNRVNKLKETLETLRNTPEKQNHIHFEPFKDEINQLINDLKSYKTDDSIPNTTNTIDNLVGLPLDTSDNDNEEKTLVYC